MNSTVPVPETTLSKMLDEIEASTQDREKRALVKALRRAIQAIPSFNFERQKVASEITAILEGKEQENKNQDLGETRAERIK